MQNGCPGGRIDQQVLGPAADAVDSLARQGTCKLCGDPPAEPGLPDDHLAHGPADDVGGDPATCSFYFGKFGHRVQ
jgi:hypothetical protein